VTVFHAGTAFGDDGRVVASGGRVLNVGATGATLAEALRRAYAGARALEWPAMVYRRDIGRDLLVHETPPSESGIFRLDQILPPRNDDST